MSFTFVENHSFEWPVVISYPKDGGHKDVTITGHFAVVDDTTFFARPDEDVSYSAGVDHEITRIAGLFKGWKAGDVKDASGNDIEPTEANIRTLLSYRPARLGVTAAYQQAMTPTKGFRAKN